MSSSPSRVGCARSSTAESSSRGGWELQTRIGELERTARLIRSFQSTMVIGLFQTSAYATMVLAQPDSAQLDRHQVDEAVTERVARQPVLDDPNKQVRAVMTEGALTWQAGSPQIMADQISRLVEVVGFPTVQLGIIPWTQPVSFLRRHGFHIYDTDAVSFGNQTAFAIVTGRADVDAHLELFGALEQSASYGEEAKDHLDRIAADYPIACG